MSKSRWSSALAAAPIAALLLTGTVAAQDEPERDVSPRAADPALCAAEPAAAADVAAALTATEPGPALEISLPLGQPVDAETATAVEDTTRELLACLNAGDFLRAGSLTTGNGAKLLFGGLAADGPEALDERLASEPVARVDEAAWVRLVGVTDVSVMADGRIAAFVILNEPVREPRGLETLLFVFQQEGDALKLDQLLGFSVIPPSVEGTPEAEGTPAA